MKEEDFIKKLENLKLPDIKQESHRCRLMKALLDAGYQEKQRAVAEYELKRSGTKGVKERIMGTIIQSLISRQPVWKTATFSIVAIALILGLSLALPGKSDSVYAQAEETIQGSAAVKAALGGEEVQIISIDISDLEVGKVVAKNETRTVLATVDLARNKVTDVTSMASFEVDDQAAIEIAKADPRVRDLLNSGATIVDEVTTMYLTAVSGNVQTGETDEVTEAIVMVDIITENGDCYVAYIDMAEGEVTKLLKALPGDSPSGSESSVVPDVVVIDSETDK